MKVSAIILGAGFGKRIGGRIPKQFLKLKDKSLLEILIDEFKKEKRIYEIIVTVPERYLNRFKNRGKVKFIKGGILRQDSVFLAGKLIKKESDYVLIHDASRPFLNYKMIKCFIDNLKGEDALIFGRPAIDTLKFVKENFILRTVSRKNIWYAETPQGFKRKIFMRMLEVLEKSKKEFTDDSEIAERLGVKVKILKTPDLNFKITFKEDIKLIKLL